MRMKIADRVPGPVLCERPRLCRRADQDRGVLRPVRAAANIGTPTKLVAQMVGEQINKEGGINGRPIELIFGDTESDPAKAAVIAKKFIFNDKVAAIIGPTSTAEGMSVKKIVEEAGCPC